MHFVIHTKCSFYRIAIDSLFILYIVFICTWLNYYSVLYFKYTSDY